MEWFSFLSSFLVAPSAIFPQGLFPRFILSSQSSHLLHHIPVLFRVGVNDIFFFFSRGFCLWTKICGKNTTRLSPHLKETVTWVCVVMQAVAQTCWNVLILGVCAELITATCYLIFLLKTKTKQQQHNNNKKQTINPTCKGFSEHKIATFNLQKQSVFPTNSSDWRRSCHSPPEKGFNHCERQLLQLSDMSEKSNFMS